MEHANGQVAVITGGASGIGLALAQALAARGDTVVLSDVDADAATSAAARLGQRVSAAHLDVTDAAAVQALVDETVSRHGRLDLMFNNAGVAVSGEVRDLNLEHWRRVIDVNLLGVVYGTDAVYKLMVRQGHGHIINIASLAGLIPFPTNAPYGATKHAVVGLSYALRLEGEKLGVKVSVVCPGFIESNIYTASEAVNVSRDALAAGIPFRKVPADVAARRILAGVARNQALIVFPAYARVLWCLQRLNHRLTAWLSRRMLADFRGLRQNNRDSKD
ncbi:MAG: SDR family oxidoreductase [Gammaproteobacteria bacterium]